MDPLCDELRAVVGQVHEDPHDVTLPGLLSLRYETDLSPSLGEPHPLGVEEFGGIRVWPRLHEDDEALTFTILHEVAHIYDRKCLDFEDREAWMEARGAEGSWYERDPWASPIEDYADAWAVCQGADPGWWTTTLAGPPTDEECGLVD